MVSRVPGCDGLLHCKRHDWFGLPQVYPRGCPACEREGAVVGGQVSKVTRGAGTPESRIVPGPSDPAPSLPRGRESENAMAEQLEAAGYCVLTYGEWLRTAIQTGAWSHDVVREFPWGLALDPKRKFRSDFALVGRRLLIEVDGGAHAAGKKKVERDTERRGLAAADGWRVLAVTPKQVRDGDAINLVRAATGRRA